MDKGGVTFQKNSPFALPSGTITLLFTDIEGSTQLWQNHYERMGINLELHDAIVRQAVEANNGIVFKTIGDAFCAVFSQALDAVQAARDAQAKLDQVEWGEAPIRVRMGLHTGDAVDRDFDYFGPTVNRVARLISIGHGKQVLLSESTADLVSGNLPAGLWLKDLGMHHLKDITRLERVYQLCAGELQADFPRLRSLFRGNLPAGDITSFIGREQELEDVRQLLGRNRLVTLTGFGGSGKTRLALHVAQELQDQFQDGAWLIELAPIERVERIAPVFFSAFELPNPKGRKPGDAILEYLRDKQLLIVMDNCEHLIQGIAELVSQILKAAPQVVVLATSREAIHVRGEQIYHVPLLHTPDPVDLPNAQQLASYDSVQLFIERAASIEPEFQLNKENAASVARICHRLDGIPLSIELAAALVDVLSPGQIAAHLEGSYKILETGPRDSARRQQTLQDVIDWSYDLLSTDERILFNSLAVFSGGWQFAGAEAVFEETRQAGGVVLSVLNALVRKSMIQRGKGERYFMLETVRQYALEKLHQSGQFDATSDRHAAYYLEFLRQNRNNFQLLETEWLNLAAVFDYSLANDLGTEIMEYAELASDVIFDRGHLEEGLRIFDKALQLTQEHAAEDKAARFEYLLGRTCYQVDQFERSIRLLQSCLRRLAQESTLLKADALFYLAINYYSTSQNEEARKTVLESRVTYQAIGNQLGFALTLSLEGAYGLYDEDLGPSYQLLIHALEIQRTIQDYSGCIRTLTMLARHEVEKKKRTGDVSLIAAAEKHALEARDLSEEINDWYERPYVLDTLALVYYNLGEWEKAQWYALEGLKKMVYSGPSQDRAQMLYRLCWIADEMAEYEDALSYGRQSFDMFEMLGDRRGMAYVLSDLGIIDKKMGNIGLAREAFLRSMELLREVGDQVVLEDVKKMLSECTP